MINYYVAGISGVLLTSFSQVLLKIGAKKGANKKLIFSFLNPFTIIGYFFLFIVTLLNLYAYKGLPLKTVVIFLPITFILVTIFSFFILKEQFSNKQSLGAILIILGVIVFNIR